MENKPREFRLTVHFDGLIPRIFFNNFVQMSTFKSEEQLHVIEYEAYENLESKLKIAVEALSLTATAKSISHLVYPECLCTSCIQKKAIKEIEGSIEKE